MVDFQYAIDTALADSPPRDTVNARIYDAPQLEQAHRKKVLERLTADSAEHHQGPNRLHIGVAGFFNFQIAALTKPDYLLLLDYNHGQESFWKGVIQALRTSSTAIGFQRFPNAPELSESGFQHLKKLALNGHIATATINIITDHERAQKLGRALSDLTLKTDTAYWSNIAALLMPRKKQKHEATHDDVFSMVFKNGKIKRAPTLAYPKKGFSGHIFKGIARWDGQEIHNGKLIAFDALPPFEKFMRNISAIGGNDGMHILTDLSDAPGSAPLIMIHGAPRHSAILAARRERAQKDMDEGRS